MLRLPSGYASLKHKAAKFLPEDVDAVGAGSGQKLRNAGGPVVKGGVEAKLVLDMAALLLAPLVGLTASRDFSCGSVVGGWEWLT
jgi:hypothetical protein